MTLTATCELTHRLPLHLQGSLPPDEEREFVAHLDGCEICQQSFEQLAVGEHAHLLAAARQLDEEPVTAQFDLSSLVARLGQQALVDTWPSELLGRAQASPLDYLDPPRAASHLGRLDHYEVIELIARGGMGIVLKAIDEKLGRTVCLKVLAPQIAAHATARQRFMREAQAAAAVHSPHVVPIHAVCESEGLIYIVLEYVAGQSLQHHITGHGPLPIDDVIRIGRDVATGLAAVHALGLVHRDVKPGNILLDAATGLARLTDFGLARAVDDTSITREGVIGGTPEYMSPEQARGRAVDHRSDLFSLGSVLYLMVTGSLPFEADGSLATLKRICDDAPPPLETLRPDIPSGLAALIRRLHAKRPADRPASAKEVAQALSSLDPCCFPRVAGQPCCERVPDAQTQPSRGDSGLGYLAAGAVALACALCLIGLWQVIIRVKGPDGQMTEIQPPAGATVQLQQNGREVATVKNLATGSEFRTLDGHPSKVWNVAFAGNGRALSAGADNWVRVWDVESGKEIQRFDGHSCFVYALAVAPDGRLALSGSGSALGAKDDVDWSVCLWEIESGKELKRLAGRGVGVTSVAFSRDGKQAVIAFYEGSVLLMDVETWTETKRFQTHQGLWSVCLAPDGRHVLTAGGQAGVAEVRLWNVADGKLVRRFVGHKFGAWHAVFLPDGRSLLSAGQDETLRLWNTETGQQLGIFRHQGQVLRAAVTADGHFALAGAWVGPGRHNLRLFQLDPAEETQVFQGHSIPLNAVALSPDGQWGLAGGNDGSLRLWKMPAAVRQGGASDMSR